MPLPVFLAGFASKPFIAPIVKFFRSITAKQWLYFLVAVFMAIMVYRGYNWIYDRGAASRQPEIDQLAHDLKIERDRIKNWQDASKASQKTFDAAQADLKKQLSEAMDLANTQAGQREVVIREIPRYITKADDAACLIPVNVGLVHNRTIEGQDATRGDGLSRAAPGVQGRASTLTLSEYARINGQNNNEAVRRGRMIRQWERWYDTTAAQWKKAQQEGVRTIYSMPEAPTSRLDDAPQDTTVSIDQPVDATAGTSQPKLDLVLEPVPPVQPLALNVNLDASNETPYSQESGWDETAASDAVDQAVDGHSPMVPGDSSGDPQSDPSGADGERFATWRVAA